MNILYKAISFCVGNVCFKTLITCTINIRNVFRMIPRSIVIDLDILRDTFLYGIISMYVICMYFLLFFV